MSESSSTEFTQRREVIARALESVLADGEQYVIRCADGEVQVLGTEAMEVRQRHPQLYGHLLSLHEQINYAGNYLTMVALIATGLFCLGIHLEWWDDWLGAAAMDKLRSGWFYVVAMVAAFLTAGTIAGWLEGRAYRHGRNELLDAMRAEGLNRETLLALIQDDEAVAKASDQLKLDRGASDASRP